MSEEDISITYENNIFYCTKKGVRWISVDGEKWYGEEKRIEELENKIADIKANCDLAIEGRDIKIQELEKENAELKKSVNNWLKYEKETQYHKSIIKDLKKENAELKKKIGIYQKGMYDEIEKRDRKLTKAKDLIKNIIRVTWGEGWNYSLDWKVKAEQFLKEIEK